MYGTAALLHLFNELQRSRKAHPDLQAHINDRAAEISSLLLEDSPIKMASFLTKTDFSMELATLGLEIPRNLEVIRIEYRSPGGMDFFGLGQLGEIICGAYTHTLDVIADGAKRKALTEEEKLKNIQTILDMMRANAGLSADEFKKLTIELLSDADRTIRRLVREHKLPSEAPILV